FFTGIKAVFRKSSVPDSTAWLGSEVAGRGNMIYIIFSCRPKRSMVEAGAIAMEDGATSA
ncbi:hypothetical protein, partial [Mycobacterium avium]